jgi:hypothetical protein
METRALGCEKDENLGTSTTLHLLSVLYSK